jgi:hypothetical protein
VESESRSHTAVKTSPPIIWIDDNPQRERTADDLNAEFRNVQKENLADVVSELFKGAQPHLVIIDHILDQATTNDPLLRRGSTIAEAIKERWPTCPVVGVTNADNVNDIDLRTKRAYDALLPFVHFGRYFDQITGIAREFARVARKKPTRPRDIVDFLKPPAEEKERLEAALPDDLKASPGDASAASRLYRWVKRLLDRPGFLYDQLWAATFLGLTPEGFETVKRRLTSAEYGGLFANADDPHWWVSRLSEILYREAEPRPSEMSWHLGRRLPSIKRRHYSRCYVCGEEYPETVAYLDASSEERHPMHLKCTELHPRYKRELYLEDMRIMRGT